MTSSRILCLGIGNMGAALAGTLLRSGGHDITIWNRTSTRPQIKPLVEAGARLELDLASALASSDVIVICLLDYPSVFAALTPFASALVGKVVINLTNGTPRQSTEAQEWMRANSVARYFDGAVMVTPQMVGGPQAFLIYSGETEGVFRDTIADLVAPLGTAVYVGEDVASAATSDLAALAAMYGMFSGAFIGIGLLKRQLAKAGNSSGGVAPAVKSIVVPLLTALVPYVGLIAETADKEDWDDDLGNPLGMQLVGVRNILQACEEEGVNGGGLESIAELMQKIVDERGGDGGVAEVAKHVLK